MKPRLILACALIVHVLCGCVTAPPRATGSLGDKTYKQDIGKTLPQVLPGADCEVR